MFLAKENNSGFDRARIHTYYRSDVNQLIHVENNSKTLTIYSFFTFTYLNNIYIHTHPIHRVTRRHMRVYKYMVNVVYIIYVASNICLCSLCVQRITSGITRVIPSWTAPFQTSSSTRTPRDNQSLSPPQIWYLRENLQSEMKIQNTACYIPHNTRGGHSFSFDNNIYNRAYVTRWS